MDKINTRELTTRRPWRTIRPGKPGSEENVTDIMTEADMLRQYYPTGHIINSSAYYPDIYREVYEDRLDENGDPTGEKIRRVYKECVPRYAFAFQQIIALKQLVHLSGNDIQCDISVDNPDENQKKAYNEIREGWMMKDMETALYGAMKGEKVVAHSAIVGYLDNGSFGVKPLSFLDGDMLYPHYDSLTGRMKVFARTFSDYDTDGAEMTQWLEVWDEKYLYRYKRNVGGPRSISDVIAGIFRVDGWQRVDKKPHGFPFVPVAYKRNDAGPCWIMSQDSIDAYDLSFSQMAHNNEAFGEPILMLQDDGEGIDIQHGLNGTIKTLSMSSESKAQFLEGQSASESYHKQLDTLYKMIYEQSFAVIPPEVHSGDLPGVAVKLLYSPALEKAMCDAAEWQPFLNTLSEIFLYGYGIEKGKTIDYTTLPLKWWIKPYIHINDSAVVADLATAVQNGFLSKQTASERNAAYSMVSEWDRIVRERKEEEKADLLYQLKTQQNNNNNSNNTEE